MAKQPSKSAKDLLARLYEQKEQALALLKQSAANLDQALKNGEIKVGDRCTIADPKSSSGERDVMVVDNFADANFVWRPLLVERHTVKSV